MDVVGSVIATTCLVSSIKVEVKKKDIPFG
jgi:hypothetical protein